MTRLRDPALPQLSQILDPRWMGPQLLGLLPAAAGEPVLRGCQVERVKYKPGRNCLVCYRLQLETAGINREQLICVRAFPAGESLSRYRKSRAARAEGVAHLPEMELVCWIFPAERKLSALQLLDDRQRLAGEVIPQLLRMRWWNQWRLRDFRHQIIHYAPEHTCSVRLEMELEDAQGRHRGWTLFGKTYYDETGARTHRNMRALELRAQAALMSARPLHYDATHRLLWQEGLEGLDLQQMRDQGRLDDRVIAAAAAALAELHACQLPDTPRVRVADDLALLQLRTSLLSQVRPDLTARWMRLDSDLRARAPADSSAATLHGDLHPKNLFHTDGRVALIDLDGLCRGAAERDLGAWLAGSAYRELLQGGDRTPDCGRRDPLYRHYLEHCVQAPSTVQVDWYTALALVNERAYRCVSRLKDGRIELLDRLLGCAEQLLQRMKEAA